MNTTPEERKVEVKWRDIFSHNSTRTCGGCRHYTSEHRFCEHKEFLTLAGATCRQFSRRKGLR